MTAAAPQTSNPNPPMKAPLVPGLILLTFLLFGPEYVGSRAAAAPPDFAGHWEGAITLPTTALGIRVDLSRSGESWQGTIDIPVQSLRGFKLDPVKVDGPTIAFAMPGIPGDPQFAGRLAENSGSVTGDFSQGGGKFPFQLERKAPPAATTEPPVAGIPGKGLEGHWQGALKPTPVIELRLALEVTDASAEKPVGVLISIDQGNARIPITALTEHDGVVHLETKSTGGIFDGKLNGDGSEIAGEWKQGRGILALVFKRLAKTMNLAPPNRPQEPKRPYPYADEEIVVENKTAGVTLAGTLTLPAGTGPHPAVVLITGSGPQDRDEAIMSHRPFLVLADHLTRQGIAVLRCDDRGFGKSTGSFAKAIDADFVEDTLAAVAYLRTRKEIDPRQIGLVGHSEGGIVAPRAAANSPEVAFIVLLAGVGVPMEDLLLRQARDISLAMGIGEDQIARNAAIQRELFPILRSEKDPAKAEDAVRKLLHEKVTAMTDEQKKAMAMSDGMLDGQIKMMLSPWFRDLLSYDPRAALRAVKCPVLAINGEKDLQVAAKENLPAIRDALAAGGNQRVKAVELPGLNHLFQRCETGAPTEYSRIEETFNPVALQLVSSWILEITAH